MIGKTRLTITSRHTIERANHQVKNVIGPTNRTSLQTQQTSTSNGRACKCCNRYICDEHKQEIDNEEHDQHIPGTGSLSSISSESIIRVVAEGWVHKKGSGKDMLGLRSWKQRWAKLALTKLPGHDVHVPVLHTFWHSSLPNPTMSITLHSTVVMQIDRPNKQDWNAHCFDIVYVGADRRVARTFTVPSKAARDEWVTTINLTLRQYEKDRAVHSAKLQREIRRAHLPPTSPKRGGRCLSPQMARSLSPLQQRILATPLSPSRRSPSMNVNMLSPSSMARSPSPLQQRMITPPLPRRNPLMNVNINMAGKRRPDPMNTNGSIQSLPLVTPTCHFAMSTPSPEDDAPLFMESFMERTNHMITP